MHQGNIQIYFEHILKYSKSWLTRGSLLDTAILLISIRLWR